MRESAAAEAVAADRQQTNQQLSRITQQIDRLDSLLRAREAAAEQSVNELFQPTATPEPRLEHANANATSPENVNASLSSLEMQQQGECTSVISPTLFLQQEKRLPYLQRSEDQDDHQRQQQLKQFMDDVTSRTSTLKELFACVNHDACRRLHANRSFGGDLLGGRYCSRGLQSLEQQLAVCIQVPVGNGIVRVMLSFDE